MNIIKVIPETKNHWLELRHKNINSTEISSLFGCNPYISEYQLYIKKRNEADDILEENERMKWGNRLQDVIANGFAADNCVEIRPMNEYLYDEDLRIGSSFDYQILGEEPAILEIKNVDSLVYSNSWTEDEAPPHIELQVQFQLLISGLKKAYICALVGGNKLQILEREYMPDVGNAILNKVKKFWARTEAPAPDFEKDSDFIKSIYQYAEPNKSIIASERIELLATAYRDLNEKIKTYEGSIDAIKAEMLTIISDAEKVKGSFFTISAGIVAESQVSFTRKSYRNFRINFKKDKSNE